MAYALTYEAPAYANSDFARAVLQGLSAPHKRIPCRFLYDAWGSALFEAITELDEYYLTRTEIALLERHAGDIAERAGEGVALIEFGSGSSRKTNILLERLASLSAYVPIDISHAALREAVRRLARLYPDLPIVPVNAEFTSVRSLPREIERSPKLGFFPGSTIGNFSRAEAKTFLLQAGGLLGAGSALLIGADLQKDERILIPAYDDTEGVTAAFNLNLLVRINRELHGNFDLDNFAHEAVYDCEAGRIEMHLVSLRDQTALVQGRAFRFARGERIHTETAHKYTVEGFAALARSAGWLSEAAWTDDARLFSVHYLRRA